MQFQAFAHFAIAASGLVLLGQLATPALAQAIPTDGGTAESRSPIAPEWSGPPRAGVPDNRSLPSGPFQIWDVRTGQPAPSEAILHLPNGRKMTVQEYLAEVAVAERRLNAAGYSLRDPGKRMQPSDGESPASPDADRRAAHWFPRGIQPFPLELMTLEGILRSRERMRTNLLKRVEAMVRMNPLPGANPSGLANGIPALDGADATQPFDASRHAQPQPWSPGLEAVDGIQGMPAPGSSGR